MHAFAQNATYSVKARALTGLNSPDQWPTSVFVRQNVRPNICKHCLAVRRRACARGGCTNRTNRDENAAKGLRTTHHLPCGQCKCARSPSNDVRSDMRDPLTDTHKRTHANARTDEEDGQLDQSHARQSFGRNAKGRRHTRKTNQTDQIYSHIITYHTWTHDSDTSHTVNE